jgi:hypothetical protein
VPLVGLRILGQVRILESVRSAVRLVGNGRLDEQAVYLEGPIFWNVNLELLVKHRGIFQEIFRIPKLARRSGNNDGQYRTKLERVANREPPYSDMFFMLIRVHRGGASHVGRKILDGIERSFDNTAVWLTYPNIFDVERLVTSEVREKQKSLAANGRFRLNLFAHGPFDGSAASFSKRTLTVASSMTADS